MASSLSESPLSVVFINVRQRGISDHIFGVQTLLHVAIATNHSGSDPDDSMVKST